MSDYLSGSNAAWLEDCLLEGSEGTVPDRWREFMERSATPRSPADQMSAGTAHDRQHRVDALVEAYRELGHLYARINPLGSYMPPNPTATHGLPSTASAGSWIRKHTA